MSIPDPSPDAVPPEAVTPEPVAPEAVSPAHGRPPASLRLVAASVVAGLVGLITVLVVIPDGAPPTALDQWVFDLTAQWTERAPWAVDAAAAIGALTDVAPSTATGVSITLLLLARRLWTFAAFVAVCGLAGVAMVETLKSAVGRQRPPGAQEFIEHGLDRSFPSGHASVGVYLYAAVALLVVIVSMGYRHRLGQWLGAALFSFGIVIGLSRIVLGVHWSTDVLAGWAFSSAIVLVATIALAPHDRASRHRAVPPRRPT